MSLGKFCVTAPQSRETLRSGNLFIKTIGKFINDPKYNLRIEVDDCDRTDDACPNGKNISTTGEVVITIDHIYMTQYYINPIANALRQLDNNRYPLDYYKSYAWDGLRAYDPNNTLKMEDNTKYYKYRSIVEENGNLCN